MSGLYPDVPGQRMAYHRDGSVGFYFDATNVLLVMSQAMREAMNDENDATVATLNAGASNMTSGIIFPELRDLNGYFLNVNGSNLTTLEIQDSVDTTNGQDGTWNTILTPFINGGITIPYYRSTIQPLSRTGKRAIRWHFSLTGSSNPTTVKTAHIYGKPSAGEVRFLQFTDVAGPEILGPHFDYGDDPRGGPVEDKTFKIKNGHGALTANNIDVSCSTLTDKSPSFADDYTFSTDGTIFTPTINIANLAPGASSGTLYVRRTTPIGAVLGLEAPLFSAIAGSWS